MSRHCGSPFHLTSAGVLFPFPILYPWTKSSFQQLLTMISKVAGHGVSKSTSSSLFLVEFGLPPTEGVDFPPPRVWIAPPLTVWISPHWGCGMPPTEGEDHPPPRVWISPHTQASKYCFHNFYLFHLLDQSSGEWNITESMGHSWVKWFGHTSNIHPSHLRSWWDPRALEKLSNVSSVKC